MPQRYVKSFYYANIFAFSGAKCVKMSKDDVYYANIFALSEKTQTIECCLKWHFFLKKIICYAKRLRCGVVILRRKFEITAAQWKYIQVYKRKWAEK